MWPSPVRLSGGCAWLTVWRVPGLSAFLLFVSPDLEDERTYGSMEPEFPPFSAQHPGEQHLLYSLRSITY